MKKIGDWLDRLIWPVLVILFCVCTGITSLLTALKIAGWVDFNWIFIMSFIWIPGSIIIGIWAIFLMVVLLYMLVAGG